MRKRILRLTTISLVLFTMFIVGVLAENDTQSQNQPQIGEQISEISENESATDDLTTSYGTVESNEIGEKISALSENPVDFMGELDLKFRDEHNQENDSYELATGETLPVLFTISLMQPEESIPDYAIALRIKVLQNNKVETSSNDYIVKYGTEDDPTGTPDPDAEYKYVWILFTGFDKGSETSDFRQAYVYMTPFVGGITDHGTASPIEATLFNLSKDVPEAVGNTKKSNIIAEVDYFSWQSVMATKTPSDMMITNATNYNFGEMAFSLYRNKNTDTDRPFGNANTESAKFITTIEVTTDNVDGTLIPLIKLDKSNFYNSEGNQIPEEDIEIGYTDTGKLAVTVTQTVTNPDITKDLTKPAIKVVIKNASVNPEAPSIAAVNQGTSGSKTISIGLSQVTTEMKSAVKLNDNFENDMVIATSQFSSSHTTVYVQHRPDVPEKGNESYINFKKYVNKIGDVLVKSENPTDVAGFVGDTVVFDLGGNFQNNQSETFKILKFTELADSQNGFDIAKILPLRLNVGKVENFVSGTITVTINFNSGNPIVNTYTPDNLTSGATIEDIVIPENQRSQVKSIEIKYENVNQGFKITSPAQVSFKVLDQNNDLANGTRVVNKMKVYADSGINHVENIPLDTEASASFIYLSKPIDNTGIYISNKVGYNLATSTDTEMSTTLPQANTAVLFVLKIENFEDYPVAINSIKDKYTSEYVTPYDGDSVTLNGSEKINSKFLSSNKYNVQFWTEDPKELDAQPNSIQVNNINEISTDEMEIEFNDIIIPANSIGYISYTMITTSKMTINNSIANEFVAYTNGHPQSEGLFIWSQGMGGSGYSKHSTKTHYNISGYIKENNIAITQIDPYSNDVVLFNLRIKNDNETPWKNITILDTFNDKYEVHSGSNNINPALLSGLKQSLNYDNIANFTIIGSSNNNFNLEDISYTVDDNRRQIFIDLGDNELNEGEYIDLAYTLKVVNGAKSNDELINDVDVFAGQEKVDIIRDQWKVNISQNSYGLLNLVKAATSDSNSINALKHGDKVDYEITVQNIHVRKNYYLDLKTIIDTLPENVVLDEDSISFTYIKTVDGVETEVAMPTGWTTPNISYEDKTLKVEFNEAFRLTSPEYNQQFRETTSYRLVMKYSATIDTNSLISVADKNVVRRNEVKAFFLNEHTQIKKANIDVTNVQVTADIDSDVDTDYDDNPLTLSYYGTSANVTILNDRNNYAELTISRTHNNKTSAYNIISMSEPFDSVVKLENKGQKDFDVEKFVIILPYGETINADTIQIVYPGSPTVIEEVPFTVSTYYDDAGFERQRIIVDGPITIQASKDGTSANTLLKFSSDVMSEKISEQMLKNEEATFKSELMVGYYLPEGETITNQTETIENDIFSNWDGDETTTHHYGGKHIQEYTTNYVIPILRLESEIITIPVDGTEIYTKYDHTSDFIAPEDYFALNITYGSVVGGSKLEAGTKIVLILEKGVRFVSYGYDSNGELMQYPNLSEPVITYDNEGNQIITWELLRRSNTTDFHTFRVRVKSEDGNFTSYRQEALLIPLNEGGQIFYESVVLNKDEYTKYGYIMRNENISHYLPEYTDSLKFISSATYIDVFGTLGITALQTATDIETNETVSSRDNNIYLKLGNKDNVIRYNLTISSLKTTSVFEDITLIDRLASEDDLTPYTNQSRRSDAKIRLVDEGNIGVTIKDSDNSITTLNEDDYVVYYYFGSSNDEFTKNDYTTGRVEGRWLTKEDVLNSGFEFIDATAFKVKVSPEIVLGGLSQITVSFDGKLNDYHVGGLRAMNNFGYNVNVSQGSFSLFSEVSKVSVDADIVLDRITINKTLLDESSNPLRKEFKFEIKGYDKYDELAYEHPETVTLTVTQDEEGTWTGSTNVYGLPYGLRYEVTENQEVNFKEPVVEIETIDNVDNTTEWIFNFTNERIVKEITANTYWRNSRGEDLDSSQLPGIEARLHIIKETLTRELSDPISNIQINSNSNWQGSFGSFSIYEEELDENNEKVLIKFAAEADDVVGYTKSITFDEENYVFDIVYIQDLGSVTIHNTDISENKLNGGEFGLYNDKNELITEFTISTNGQFTIDEVEVGNYTIKQLIAPTGFELNTNVYPFSIETDQLDAVVYVINHKTPEEGVNTPETGNDKPEIGDNNQGTGIDRPEYDENGNNENDSTGNGDSASTDELPKTGISDNSIKIYNVVMIVGMVLLLVSLKKKTIKENQQ